MRNLKRGGDELTFPPGVEAIRFTGLGLPWLLCVNAMWMRQYLGMPMRSSSDKYNQLACGMDWIKISFHFLVPASDRTLFSLDEIYVQNL